MKTDFLLIGVYAISSIAILLYDYSFFYPNELPSKLILFALLTNAVRLELNKREKEMK